MNWIGQITISAGYSRSFTDTSLISVMSGCETLATRSADGEPCPVPGCKVKVHHGDVESHRKQYHLTCQNSPECGFRGDWIEYADHSVHCAYKRVPCPFGCRDAIPRNAMLEHERKYHAACANAAAGCDFRGEHYRVVAHEDRCGFQLVPCPIKGCGAMVKRSGVESHKVLFHIPCRAAPLCTFQGEWVALKDHAKRCQYRPVTCKFGCREKVQWDKLAEHDAHFHIRCRFQGCQFRGQAFEVKAHEPGCPMDTAQCRFPGCRHRCQRHLMPKHERESHVPCKYAPRCGFTGDLVAAADHAQQCQFRHRNSISSLLNGAASEGNNSSGGGGANVKSMAKAWRGKSLSREKVGGRRRRSRDLGPSCWE